MNNLWQQIVKFGIVGVICFFIDMIVGFVVMKILVIIAGEEFFTIASVIGNAFGFAVSVVVNYILSFKFVFERKEDLDRRAEAVIFLILSLIGLGLSSLIMWLGVDVIYGNIAVLRKIINNDFMYALTKIVATGIVMVYNFVSRKIFLEKKDR